MSPTAESEYPVRLDLFERCKDYNRTWNSSDMYDAFLTGLRQLRGQRRSTLWDRLKNNSFQDPFENIELVRSLLNNRIEVPIGDSTPAKLLIHWTFGAGSEQAQQKIEKLQSMVAQAKKWFRQRNEDIPELVAGIILLPNGNFEIVVDTIQPLEKSHSPEDALNFYNAVLKEQP